MLFTFTPDQTQGCYKTLNTTLAIIEKRGASLEAAIAESKDGEAARQRIAMMRALTQQFEIPAKQDAPAEFNLGKPEILAIRSAYDILLTLLKKNPPKTLEQVFAGMLFLAHADEFIDAMNEQIPPTWYDGDDASALN